MVEQVTAFEAFKKYVDKLAERSHQLEQLKQQVLQQAPQPPTYQQALQQTTAQMKPEMTASTLGSIFSLLVGSLLGAALSKGTPASPLAATGAAAQSSATTLTNLRNLMEQRAVQEYQSELAQYQQKRDIWQSKLKDVQSLYDYYTQAGIEAEYDWIKSQAQAEAEKIKSQAQSLEDLEKMRQTYLNLYSRQMDSLERLQSKQVALLKAKNNLNDVDLVTSIIMEHNPQLASQIPSLTRTPQGRELIERELDRIQRKYINQEKQKETLLEYYRNVLINLGVPLKTERKKTGGESYTAEELKGEAERDVSTGYKIAFEAYRLDKGGLGNE